MILTNRFADPLACQINETASQRLGVGECALLRKHVCQRLGHSLKLVGVSPDHIHIASVES